MKAVKLYFALFLLVFAAVACSVAQDKPTNADIEKALKNVPLQPIVIDKTEYAGKDKDGKLNVGVWGQAKDGAEDINIYVILLFEKNDSAWIGTIPSYGLVGEPLKEISKADFYKQTSADWEKLKEKIKSGK